MTWVEWVSTLSIHMSYTIIYTVLAEQFSAGSFVEELEGDSRACDVTSHSTCSHDPVIVGDHSSTTEMSAVSVRLIGGRRHPAACECFSAVVYTGISLVIGRHRWAATGVSPTRPGPPCPAQSSNLLRLPRLTGNTCYLLVCLPLAGIVRSRSPGTRHAQPSRQVGGAAKPAAMSRIILVIRRCVSLYSLNSLRVNETGWENGDVGILSRCCMLCGTECKIRYLLEMQSSIIELIVWYSWL